MPDKSLSEKLDGVEDALDRNRLPATIFNDQQIFEAEMERIFTRCWVFVAHESEIPNKGDFVRRQIGLDNVIVTRDNQGEIRVLSNYCRHRGTELCQAESGNAARFTCPYHGWTFKNDGDFLAAPNQAKAYGGKLDAREWGLFRAPHVDSHMGFIFASLDPNAAPLLDYLGGAAWIMEAMVGIHPGGMKVAGPPERFRVKANWKSAAENFSVDSYHVPFLHQSTGRVGLHPGKDETPLIHSFEFDGGHNFIGIELTMINPHLRFGGLPPHYAEQLDLSKLSPTQVKVAGDWIPFVGNVFPNFSMIRHPSNVGYDARHIFVTSYRQWQPISPTEMEIINWQFVWPYMSQEDQDYSYAVGQFTFGSAGLFEQDDTVVWEGITKAGASPWMRQQGMEFNFDLGQDPSIFVPPDPDWDGPGVHRKTPYSEYRQLKFYRHWLKMMRENISQNTAKGGKEHV